MRITNAMMTNTTLLHINRNMRQLDEIIRQIETTKRVGVPSDDPIVASRALKFRTSVLENEQFQRNVTNGIAWMNVTESTFTNINSELLMRIRELAVTAATGTNTTITQRQTIITQMESLFQEIGNSLNQTMAGKHLFSGLRTNEPPIFNQGNNRSFVITQHFNLSSIERTNTFQRLARPDGLMETKVHQNVSIINLAYRGLDTTALRAPDPSTTPPTTWQQHVDNPAGINIPGFHVRKVSINDPNAYLPPHMSGSITDAFPAGSLPTPPRPVLHLIAETGELVMHNDTASSLPREGISVTYQKTGFNKGDINPAVYFTSREIIDTTVPANWGPGGNQPANTVYGLTQYLSRAAGIPLDAGGNIIDSSHADYAGLPNSASSFRFELAYIPTYWDETNPNHPPGLLPQLPPGAVFNPPGSRTVEIQAHLFQTQSNISVTYNVTNPSIAAGMPPLPPGHGVTHIMQDPRVQGVSVVRALDPLGVPIPLDQVDHNRSFDMHDQDMRMEFSTNTHVAINSLAKNVLTDKMFADFRRLFEFSNALRVSTSDEIEQHYRNLFPDLPDAAIAERVEAQLIKENADAAGALYAKLNNMLFHLETHSANSNREQTLLGARMVRMELLQNRLEQDEVSLTDLKSTNEDTDMIRAIILRMSAEAAFMASLQANSGIVQMSLANFIR